MKDEFPNLKKDFQKKKKADEKKQEPEQKNDAIKIDVSSAEKLFANLSYASQELSAAVEKVEKNRDLGKILDKLSELQTGDLKNFDKNLSKNLNKIETSVLQKMSSYAAAFESDDVVATLDSIERLENFTKQFKFKSIVFATLLSIFISIVTSYSTFYLYFQNKNKSEISKYKTELTQKLGAVATVFSNLDFQIGENQKIYQINIKSSGVSVFTDKNEKFINILKRSQR